MKEVLLKIKKCNWSMIEPNSWVSTEWIIYSDLSVEIKNEYNKTDGIKIENKLITQEEYNNIIINLESAKKDDKKVTAFDGVAWQFEQYDSNNLIWKRELDYIYGIKSLENISNILYSIS